MADALSPQELDRLEDALENLEFSELLHDESPEVTRTLADYQQILVASRDALPLAEVRPGLLDGVLAEARASVEGHVLGIGEVPTPQEKPVSFWTKLRRGFLIPGLAVAGSAALILLIVKPQMGDSPVASVSQDEAAADSVSKDASAKADKAMASPPPPAPSEDAPAEPLIEADEEEAAAAGEAKLEEIAVSRMSANKKAPGAAAGAAPAAAATPAPADPAPDEKSKEAEKDADAEKKADPSASWDDVEKGDLARSNGDCFGARNAYRRALDDGNDSVRARALAGIGLCEAKEGDDTAAGEYFDQAEELDPEVESYISTQRVDAPKPAPKSKRKPSKKRRSKSMPKNSYDDIESPFK